MRIGPPEPDNFSGKYLHGYITDLWKELNPASREPEPTYAMTSRPDPDCPEKPKNSWTNHETVEKPKWKQSSAYEAMLVGRDGNHHLKTRHFSEEEMAEIAEDMGEGNVTSLTKEADVQEDAAAEPGEA